MDVEVAQYELQLSQIQNEISLCTDEDKRDSLLQLESDIKELINLTKESLGENENKPDDLDAEYELFKAELAADEEETGDNKDVCKELNDLQEDLESLPGMKCQAPFTYAWSDEPVYHNALVYRADRAEEINCNDIRVWVMFTNPTHNDMKPCPYYLDGECKFSRESCKFSHGEVVALSNLRDYKEPDFTVLRKGSHVLVKLEDELWHKAQICSISDDDCVVKLETTSKEVETHLQNIFPVDSNDRASNDCSMDESSDDDVTPHNDIAVELEREAIIRKIFSEAPTSMLGEWEQHTKGFGSRMMAKMGYIHGAGLGAKADGRVEPVPAVIYPTGKSLDHCMMLKEKAGGDKDLFKAEKKMKRMQKKHQEALNRAYDREKQRSDVFTFLNGTLGPGSSSAPAKPQKKLGTETQKELNVSSLRIAEDVKIVEREKSNLHKSLARHALQSPAHAAIKEKIYDCDRRLVDLHESERKISTELQQRKDRKKLTVF